MASATMVFPTNGHQLQWYLLPNGSSYDGTYKISHIVIMDWMQPEKKDEQSNDKEEKQALCGLMYGFLLQNKVQQSKSK